MTSDVLCVSCGRSLPPEFLDVVLVEGDDCFDGCYVVVCVDCNQSDGQEAVS